MGSFSSATGAVTLGMMLLGQRIFKVAPPRTPRTPRTTPGRTHATRVAHHHARLLARTAQVFGWGVAALITPTLLFATGATFFALTLFSARLSPLVAALGTTPLMLAVIVGACQNILSKSAKYSLFDPCKEMAYIPLDPESKTKGKARGRARTPARRSQPPAASFASTATRASSCPPHRRPSTSSAIRSASRAARSSSSL